MGSKRRFVLKPGSILILIPIIILALVIFLTKDAGAIKNNPKGEAPNQEQKTVIIEKPAKTRIQKRPRLESFTDAEHEPETEVAIEPDPEKPKVVVRYAGIEITEAELHELAEIIYHEARGESAEGQQAVAEVVFNRVIAKNFPNTVHDVLFQGKGTKVPQFTPINKLGSKTPNKEQYDAINAALYGPNILPEDVVFFSMQGENKNVWGKIGCHIFCYQYDWARQ